MKTHGLIDNGTVIDDTFGEEILVEELLSQSSRPLYKVIYRGESKVLKWQENTHDYDIVDYNRIKRLVNMGSPDESLQWPVTVTEITPEGYGLVFDILQDSFEPIAYLVNGTNKKEPDSFKTIVRVCLMITEAFRKLHYNGYCFSGIDLYDIYADFSTGEISITNTFDTVIPIGTQPNGFYITYCAPEIIVNGEYPDVRSDRFVLAEIIFTILFWGHPLEGEHWVVPCITPSLEKSLYGSDAIFIFDPDNDENRPVEGVHDNVIKRWNYMPQYIKETFIKAFSQDAIKNPDRRVTELSWLEVLTRLQRDIV